MGSEAVKPIPSVAEAMMRHDFWRAVYATLLETLPPAESGAFFRALTLTLGGRQLTLRELLDLLWSDKALVTMEWNYRATKALEPFLLERRALRNHLEEAWPALRKRGVPDRELHGD